jgi:hypothetical protein
MRTYSTGRPFNLRFSSQSPGHFSTLVRVPVGPITPGVTLAWLRRWALLLDSRFRIPGTEIRFGIDPLLSLIPGLGDLASPIFATLLIVQGLHQRVPKIILLRMLANALIDAAIGIVPIAGTVADIFWRANIRNLELLERYARPGLKPSRADYLFVFGIVAVFGMIVMVPVVLAIWLTSLFLQVIGGPGLR